MRLDLYGIIGVFSDWRDIQTSKGPFSEKIIAAGDIPE